MTATGDDVRPGDATVPPGDFVCGHGVMLRSAVTLLACFGGGVLFGLAVYLVTR